MENNIKSKLSLIKDQQNRVSHLIDQVAHHWGNERKVLNCFLEAPNYCFTHPRVINLFADFLQIIEDESLISEFNLYDIETLYRLNLETLPNELSQYEDLVHYLFSVLDDGEKSNHFLRKGIKKASTILDSLSRLEQENS